MAQGNCLTKIPPIGRNQPSVLAWASWPGGCNGAQATYPADNFDMNLCYNDSNGIGANDIDTIYVPPNVEVSVDEHCGHQDKPVRFDGRGFLGQGINYPGLYQMDTDNGQKFINDKYGNGNRISLNDIDIVHTRTTMTWDEHLNKCCKGEIEDPRLCGNYTAGKRECQEFLMKCSVDDLKNNSGCQEMCRKDPTQCDKIKYAFCNNPNNKNDPWCSCMNIDYDPAYQKFANKVIEKTGQGPRIGCAPFGRCNTGIDLLNVFIPSTVLQDRQTACPSYSSYMDQSVTTVGGNNVVTPTLVANQPGANVPGVTQPSPPEEDGLVSKLTKPPMLYVLLLIVAIVIGYFAFGGSDQQQMYAPQMYAPQMYAPQMYAPQDQQMYSPTQVQYQ